MKGEDRLLGFLAVGLGRAGRLRLELLGAGGGGAQAHLGEGMGAPVPVIFRLRDLVGHGLPQLVGAIGVEAGGGGQALAVLVGLVFELARIFAQQQLGEHHAGGEGALHQGALAAFFGPGVGVVELLRLVFGADHHAQEGGLAEHVEQGGAPLDALAVALDHVGELVADQAGEHVVGEAEVEHAAGDENMAAGQGEGVRHRHVDQVEAEGKVAEFGHRGDPVADVEHPPQLRRTVEPAVEIDRAVGGFGALAVDLGVLDLERRLGGGEDGRGQKAREQRRKDPDEPPSGGPGGIFSFTSSFSGPGRGPGALAALYTPRRKRPSAAVAASRLANFCRIRAGGRRDNFARHE